MSVFNKDSGDGSRFVHRRFASFLLQDNMMYMIVYKCIALWVGSSSLKYPSVWYFEFHTYDKLYLFYLLIIGGGRFKSP